MSLNPEDLATEPWPPVPPKAMRVGLPRQYRTTHVPTGVVVVWSGKLKDQAAALAELERSIDLSERLDETIALLEKSLPAPE